MVLKQEAKPENRENCILCRGAGGDPDLGRFQVWEDAHWRLSMSLEAEVLGFSYLEPKRHIPHITDLDGEEALTLGPVLARVARILKEETGAELVYLYVFGGGVPHLHIHLAPHRAGDALNSQIIKGEVVEEKLASGASRIINKDLAPLPEEYHRAVARRVGERLLARP